MDSEILALTEVKLFVGLIIGLVMGSFVTMLTYRVPRKLSIVSPPSQCPRCYARLTKRDLIPVFSWLKEKGRCRHCNAHIGVRYLVIELVTTLSVAVAFMALGFTPEVIVAIVAIIAFITLATINIEKQG